METMEELRRQLEEERRRREAAEQLANTSRPQTVQQYFEACHALVLSTQVITDRSRMVLDPACV
jgi:DNA-binding protein H-NS